MTATAQPITGSAVIQGSLWGARADDWAEYQEATGMPLYESAFRKIGAGPGMALLDVGCGSGVACALAVRLGAQVSGLDASAPAIAIARGRAPGGDFRVGEMEDLPFPDNGFDAVVGFNSFQYAANPARALHEAGRVARVGAPVVVATWGQPEQCQATAYLKALGMLLPPPPGAPGPFALSADGALEALTESAGLSATAAEVVDVPFAYPDLETALRGLLSAGPAVKAIQHSGEARVRAAVAEVLAPFRTATGGYRMENKFRYVIASRPS